jgi:hypothetical protein
MLRMDLSGMPFVCLLLIGGIVVEIPISSAYFYVHVAWDTSGYFYKSSYSNINATLTNTYVQTCNKQCSEVISIQFP